jgi:hypothetical protein
MAENLSKAWQNSSLMSGDSSFGVRLDRPVLCIKSCQNVKIFSTHPLMFEVDMIFNSAKPSVPVFFLSKGYFNDLSPQTQCVRVSGQILAEYS